MIGSTAILGVNLKFGVFGLRLSEKKLLSVASGIFMGSVRG